MKELEAVFYLGITYVSPAVNASLPDIFDETGSTIVIAKEVFFRQLRAVTMSSFDESYYVLIKEHMSRLGIWPEQSRYVRIYLSLAMTTTTLTFVGPQVKGRYLRSIKKVYSIIYCVLNSSLACMTFGETQGLL